jgi:hypothetical protein
MFEDAYQAMQVHQLVMKERKAVAIGSGYYFHVILDRRKLQLGFVPWDPPSSRGVVLDDSCDHIFVPVVLAIAGQIAQGLSLPCGLLSSLS